MSGKRAFTYVELMLVLTIVLILSYIAMPNFLEAQSRAQVSRSRNDLLVLKMALTEYHLDHHTWPANGTPGVADGESLICLTTPVSYIGALPVDAMTDPETSHRVRRLGLGPHYYQYYNALQTTGTEHLRLYHTPGFAAPFSLAAEGNDIASWREALHALPPEERSPVEGQMLGGAVTHLLWGQGPSILQEQGPSSPDRPPSIVFTAPDEAFVMVYDPSNGSMPAGHIFTKLP